MRTNRLHYLHQIPDKKINFKLILLTFIVTIFLSACGIKGDLYKTPEQAVTSQNNVVEQNDASQKVSIKKSVEPQNLTVITADESKQKQAVLQPTDQVKEQQ